MVNCDGCGRKFRFLETVVKRNCIYCGRPGCNKCSAHWIYYRIYAGTSQNRIAVRTDGFCTEFCVVNYLSASPEMMDEYGAESYGHGELSYRGALYRFFNHGRNQGHLERYMEYPMAQGIAKMIEGSTDLNYQQILEGFKLCRQDSAYSVFQHKVDNLAEGYIAELKRFDVPTSATELGGVMITLSMPQNQKEMKVHSCPSCGATLDKIAVRGQVMKCQFCSSTFQIT
ncbi:MAG: FYVE zinc finger domain-containing protein [Candidatus Thorarchaeota archaeon]